MKKIAFILMSLLLAVLSFFVVLGLRVEQTQNDSQTSFVPQPLSYNLEPPRQSLTGTVLSTLGSAEKEPRDEEELLPLEVGMSLLESEKITTGDEGAVTVIFPSELKISISPETNLSFLSTNPQHFLVRQDQGIVMYQTDAQTSSISVRSLHGLFMIEEGVAEVSSDPESGEVLMTVYAGKATVGYIDKENNTQMREATAGEVLFFDDKNRTVELE